MKATLGRTNNIINNIDAGLDRVRFLSGSTLKVIAAVTMFIDHFSKIVLQWLLNYYWFPMSETGAMRLDLYLNINDFNRIVLQGIGTMAFPIFCFLLAEGFFYTRNRKRYIGMMLIFAFISEIPFDLGFFSYLSTQDGTYPFYFRYQNVFFTLFLGLAALCCIDGFSYYGKSRTQKIKSVLLQAVGIAVMAGVAELIHCDYESRGVLFIAAFYVCRRNRIYQILLFLLIYIISTGNQPTAFMLFSCLLIMLYNGQRGKLKLKYFFYIFYPLHLAILYITTILLEWLLI